MSAETTIQTTLETLLNTAAPTVMVVTEKEGDLENAIKVKLGPIATPPPGKKAGLVLVVMTPAAELFNPDVASLAREIPCPIVLMENPLVNRGAGGTGILPLDLVNTVMEAVHHKPNGLGGRDVVAKFKLEKIPYVRLRIEKDVLNQMGFTALVAYQINVTTTSK